MAKKKCGLSNLFLWNLFFVWQTIQKYKKQFVPFDYWLPNLWPNSKKKWVIYIICYPQVILQVKVTPELLLKQFWSELKIGLVEKLIKDLWKNGVSLPQAKLYFFTYFSPLNWTDSHMPFYYSSALALRYRLFFLRSIAQFSHKFTWIVLSVHKFKKLGKFW